MRFADYASEIQEEIIKKWLNERLSPFYMKLTLAQCLPVFLSQNPTLWTDTKMPERGEFIAMHDGNHLCRELRDKYE